MLGFHKKVIFPAVCVERDSDREVCSSPGLCPWVHYLVASCPSRNLFSVNRRLWFECRVFIAPVHSCSEVWWQTCPGSQNSWPNHTEIEIRFQALPHLVRLCNSYSKPWLLFWFIMHLCLDAVGGKITFACIHKGRDYFSWYYSLSPCSRESCRNSLCGYVN